MYPLNKIIKNFTKYTLYHSYLMAIDNKNKDKIKFLYYEKYKDNIVNDIVFELYNKNKLNEERLKFIVENSTTYLNISSSLIKQLMKDNNRKLLEILLKSL